MEIERQYQAALDLTHQMLSAAMAQDWNTLTGLERQRAALIEAIPPIAPPPASGSPALDPAVARCIAGIIVDIERENSAIAEQVQTWQKHARILLRIDKPAVV